MKTTTISSSISSHFALYPLTTKKFGWDRFTGLGISFRILRSNLIAADFFR